VCGIIAANQSKDVSKFLIEGLRKLEYRGYDSCGIGIWKRWGKPTFSKSLDINKLQLEKGNVGIAHTRWATHGNIDIRNAHPILDSDNKVAVVHNGIVTNLKELIGDNTLKTDTDTEIIANILSNTSGDLIKRVSNCNNIVKGNSAYICWFLESPQYLFCTTNNQPLYVSSNGLCSSDKNSLGGEEIYKLKNGEIAQLEQDKTRVYKDNVEISPMWEKNGTSTDFLCSSAPYPHFMLKEIHDQISLQSKKNYEFNKMNKLTLVGCGSSYYAAKFAQPFFDNSGIDTRVEYATELLWKKLDLSRDYILISQSGETKNIIDIAQMIDSTAQVNLLTNNHNSSIKDYVYAIFNINVGPEYGVAATKTFLGSILTLIDLANYYGSKIKLNYTKFHAILDKILSKEDLEYADLYKDNIKSVAESIAHYNNMYVLGHGYNYPIALEGALKLKEVSCIHAEGMISSEIKHGPITLTGPDTLCLFLNFGDNQEVQSNISQAKARKSQCLVITNHLIDSIGVHKQIFIPTTNEVTFALSALVILQLLSYYCAVKKELNPDKPKMLAKAVTV
jgi:glucosamine--fructose-6-phosphate aminotransferase (isomerizing)